MMSTSRSFGTRPSRRAGINRLNYYEETASDPDSSLVNIRDRNDTSYQTSPSPVPAIKRRGRPPRVAFNFGTNPGRTPLRSVSSFSSYGRGVAAQEPAFPFPKQFAKPYSIPKDPYSDWHPDYDMPSDSAFESHSLEQYLQRWSAITESEAPPYFKAMAHFRLGEKLDEQDGVSGRKTAIQARNCFERAQHHLSKAKRDGDNRDPTHWDTDAKWEGRLARYIMSAMRTNWERVRVAMLEEEYVKSPLKNKEIQNFLFLDGETGEERFHGFGLPK